MQARVHSLFFNMNAGGQRFVPSAKYQAIVQYAKLPSIDLIFINEKGQILMGRRKNRPAQDKWFVPGGVIKKGELSSIHEREFGLSDTEKEKPYDLALRRIIYKELFKQETEEAKLLIDDFISRGRFVFPTYDHVYDDNIYTETESKSDKSVDSEDFPFKHTTEYIVQAYCIPVEISELNIGELPLTEHKEWEWINKEEDERYHYNCKPYFDIKYCSDIEYAQLNQRRISFNQLINFFGKLHP